jgi:hypothetical protein
MKRLGIFAALLGAIAILSAIAIYLILPYFQDEPANKPSPFTFPDKTQVGMILPDAPTKAQRVAERFMPPPSKAEIISERLTLANYHDIEVTPAILFLGPIPEAAPEATPEPAPEAKNSIRPLVPAKGNFAATGTFKAKGSATVYSVLDGTYLLRLENLNTSSGPALHIVFSPNANPTDEESLGDYLDFGRLESNVGTQNYRLPDTFDPTRYKSVVIYSKPLRKLFAVASFE